MGAIRKRWATMAIAVLALGSGGAAQASYVGTEGMTLLWHFDEAGTTPTATDATANGFNGDTQGNVTGGAASPEGSAYEGFTSPTSNVSAVVLGSNAFASIDFTFLAWVKNPNLSDGATALIARGADARLGQNSNVPWQLWIDDTGAVNLSVQDWGGKHATYTSAALTWDADQWYQVALVEDYRINSGIRSQTFKVYVTPVGGQSVGDPVIDETYSNGGAGLANGKTLVVGGGQKGYYPSAPGGAFGGQIDEVSFWRGVALTPEQLNQSLTVFAPEPASAGLLLAGALCLARRRR